MFRAKKMAIKWQQGAKGGPLGHRLAGKNAAWRGAAWPNVGFGRLDRARIGGSW